MSHHHIIVIIIITIIMVIIISIIVVSIVTSWSLSSSQSFKSRAVTSTEVQDKRPLFFNYNCFISETKQSTIVPMEDNQDSGSS